MPLLTVIALLGFLWYPWWTCSSEAALGGLLEAAGARVDGLYCCVVRDVSPTVHADRPAREVLARPSGAGMGGWGAVAGVRHFRTAYGTLPGAPPESPLALARSIARSAGIVVVEEMADGNLAAVAGYAPRWGPALRTVGGYINLQVGVRYDPGADRTRVAAGTPAVFPDF